MYVICKYYQLFSSFVSSIELPSQRSVTTIEAGANLQEDLMCCVTSDAIAEYYRKRWSCFAAASYLQKEVTAISGRPQVLAARLLSSISQLCAKPYYILN